MRLSTCLLLVAVSFPAAAAADDDRRNQFRLGMELLAKGEYDGACSAFEKSEARGPSVGSSYQLGRCNEGRGRYGLAHESYARAASLAERAGDHERASIARLRAAEVAPKAPKLVITVDHPAEGLTIRVDGKPLEDWTTPTPVAEGSHRIEVAARGRSSVTLTAEARTGTVRVTVPELALLPPAVEAEREERRRNPRLFWTGVGLTIGGGCAAIAGVAILGHAEATGADTAPPGGIGLLVGAAALLGVGIPFTIVYGRKEPAEPAASLLLGPTSAAMRVSF